MSSGAGVSPDDRDRAAAQECLPLERLERIVRRDPPVSGDLEHLSRCAICAAKLEEMRRTHMFLQRFASSADAPPQAPAEQALITLVGFQVESLIGYGGQGAVYRARQLATGRTVAIKVPMESAIREPAKRYRFQREIELTARLDHPCIVKVYGACELPDTRVACVMEYVDGTDLDAWAAAERQRGRAGIRAIVAAAERIADAVAYAHQRSVMHRDLKPSNVIIARDGLPRVLDFGLAKAIGDDSHSYATVTGAFVGTLAYAAPEQLSGVRDSMDQRTDVYGVGLLLYRMLTGRLPHDSSASPADLMREVRDNPAPRVSAVSPIQNPGLDAIATMALAREKERRYQSAAALRDDLARWLRGEPVHARSDSRWYVVRTTAWRRRRSIAILGALCVFAALLWRAKDAATRADLATAVRDARTIESHASELVEARFVSRESFEAGERAAWNMLLAPDAALVRARVESGEPPSRSPESLPTSPAYWALWEVYQRVPILASYPEPLPTAMCFSADGDSVFTTIGDQLIRWPWHTLAPPEKWSLGAARGSLGYRTAAIAGDTVVFFTEPGLQVRDMARGIARTLCPELHSALHTVDLPSLGRTANGERSATDRIVAIHKSADGPVFVEVWSLEAAWRGEPPLRIGLDEGWEAVHGAALAVDPLGDLIAVTNCLDGSVHIFDLVTGAKLRRFDQSSLPNARDLAWRGVAGEIVVLADGATYAVRRRSRDDPTFDISLLHGVAESAREIAAAPAGNRLMVRTDRRQPVVSTVTESFDRSRVIPGISCRLAGLAASGKYGSLGFVGHDRQFVLDLEGRGVRQLTWRPGSAILGPATAFDVLFTRDSSAFLVGALDGSVQRVRVNDGACEPLAIGVDPNGITRIAWCAGPTGNDETSLLVGSHLTPQQGSTLSRLDLDARRTVTPIVQNQRYWICGIATAADRRAWALTGAGDLFAIASDTDVVLRQTHLAPNAANPRHRALARIAPRNLLIAAPSDRGMQILDDESLQPVCESIATTPISKIVNSPTDPDLFATAHDDGVIRLWRLGGGTAPTVTAVGQLGTHLGAVLTIAFHPSGEIIASGGGAPETNEIRLWSVATQRELAAVDRFANGVFGMAFSPDGRWLAAVGEPDFERPGEGGQIFLIDMDAPNQCIAGNVDYHLNRLASERGATPEHAAEWRAWAREVRK